MIVYWLFDSRINVKQRTSVAQEVKTRIAQFGGHEIEFPRGVPSGTVYTSHVYSWAVSQILYSTYGCTLTATII